MLSLLDLACLELCLEELSTYLLVGRNLEGRRVLRFGRWCRSAFLGIFGGKEMEDFLASFFHNLYIWTVAFLSPLSLSYVNFLICLSLSSEVIPFVYFRCT